MSAQLLFGANNVVVAIIFIAAVAVSSVIKAVIGYWKWREHQRWFTRRLEMALRDVTQDYRESVIRACGELENGDRRSA